MRKLTRGSPSVLVKREMEPGSDVVSWTVFLLQLFLTVGSGDTVSVTLFPTTVERASCKVHTLLCTGWLPTTLIISDG